MRLPWRRRGFPFKSREEAELLLAYLRSMGMTEAEALRVLDEGTRDST